MSRSTSPAGPAANGGNAGVPACEEAAEEAAELAVTLAQADPARAATPQAGAAAAERALALASRLGREAERGQAAAWWCLHRFRLGEFALLGSEGAALLAWLQGDAQAPVRAEVLRLLTLAHGELGTYEEALRHAEELAALAGSREDPGLMLTAASAMGGVFDRIGDPWQAIQLLDKALSELESNAPPRLRLMARINLGAFHGDAVHRLHDAGREAERRELLMAARANAEQALAMLHLAPEPIFEVATRNNLGEALLLLGEAEAARPFLEAARSLAGQHGLTPYLWRAQATWAAWWLAAGDPRQARAQAEGLLQHAGAQLPAATEIRARDTAAAACRALGDAAAALEHFMVFERLERRRTLAEQRALSRLFVTRMEAQAAHWRAEQARAEAQAQAALASRLMQQAERDPLTGLGNRSYLERRAAELQRLGAPAVVAHLDLDHFKEVNDRHGHATGDAVLSGFAQLMRECTREADVLARVGGDEFVLLLPHTSPAAAAEVCERLRQATQARLRWPPVPEPLAVTLSIGLAPLPLQAPGGEPPLAAALGRADEAMYAAKRAGRDRVVWAGG